VRANANQASRRFVETQLEVIAQHRAGALPFEQASLAIEHVGAGALRRAVIDGDVENGSLWAGQSVGLIAKEPPLAEILAELVAQTVAALERDAAPAQAAPEAAE
jgi:enoyl-[acyl-carrier protein] reductase II